jgi:hypothetical protein
MKGRWTMYFSPRGYVTSPLSRGAIEMPVVPCDDAAVERGIVAYEEVIDQWTCQDAPPSREVVEAVLRAAGDAS